jgi:hypothetical protein
VIKLVARRELTERIHERSFLISTGITLAIVVVVLLLPTLLGFGGPTSTRSRPAMPRAARSSSAPPGSPSRSTRRSRSATTTRTPRSSAGRSAPTTSPTPSS